MNEDRQNRSQLSRHFKYTKPGIERLAEEEARKMDAVDERAGRAFQHSVLLQLATFSHGRHVRDKRMDTLTRLMSSSAAKLKGRSGNTTKGVAFTAPRDPPKEKRRSSGHVSLIENKDAERRKSSSSSGHSGASVVTKFADNRRDSEASNKAKRKLSRCRALSVDLFANPTINMKRRLSAPEVIVTPAVNFQQDMKDPEESSKEGHLSPSFSTANEFFGTNTRLSVSDTSEHPPLESMLSQNSAQSNVTGDSNENSRWEGQSLQKKLMGKKRSNASAAASFAGALLAQQGSRKLSRSSNATSSRRRSSHLSAKGQLSTQADQFNPEKDPR